MHRALDAAHRLAAEPVHVAVQVGCRLQLGGHVSHALPESGHTPRPRPRLVLEVWTAQT